MRRRVAALAVVLVVVALVVWGLTAAARSGTSDASDTSAPASPTEQYTTEPTVSLAEQPSNATSTKPDASDTAGEPTTQAQAPAEGKDTCSLEDLIITARTSEPSFGPGQQPTFYMHVENPTQADCVIDLAAQQLRFEVYDMASNQRVWSDTDCHPAVVTGEETFAPGKARDFAAVWSRKDSQPGACSNRQDVPAGSYFLHAVIGEHASDPADFNLRT